MLARMRAIGLPEQKLMECLRCGQIMGQQWLLQLAHSNFCPPPEPQTAPRAAPTSEARPAT